MTDDRASTPPDRPNIGERCLVTGAAGFLGQALVEALLERGHRVTGLDVRPAFEGRDGVRFVCGDIRDPAVVASAAEGAATVFNTAAILKFYGICTPAQREEIFSINLGGTENVIEACRAQGIPRLL